MFKSPVYNVKAIPVEKIKANEYNPNHVMSQEMKLLYESIKADVYTMPIVCYYDAETDTYIVVDGFHRRKVMLEHKDIYEREQGLMPVVTIDKPLNERMASTIRHNRARGVHETQQMSNIVVELLKLGWKDYEICKQLGMDADELLRLKQIIGVDEIYQNEDYGRAWV
jgi:ParB-like chromosome segregation protein Spo0J